MNKLAALIAGLGRDDLLKIKRDLEEGNLQRLLENRLSELDENKVCPVCHKKASRSDYVLEFGPPGLRMRASFDALDCLEHFILERRRLFS